MVFILLHGWGSDPEKFNQRWKIREAFTELNILTVFPERSKRWIPRWYPEDDKWIVKLVKEFYSPPIMLGGFSDGARTALRASMLIDPPIKGLIFHSGVYVPEEIPIVPLCPVLVIAGKKDKTRSLPFNWGTNSYELYQDHPEDCTWYEHPGKHEWHSSTNDRIKKWINDNCS